MKVALEVSDRKVFNSNVVLRWKTSKPFVRNSRGKLIHRVRSVEMRRNDYNYLSVKMHCGLSVNGSAIFTFIDEPEDGEIVCHACEKVLAERGLETSEELLGRHVHIGGVKAFQMCCGGDEK